ncbi:MAG: class II fructose-bisphosphate aldolase [Bacilli bacterium]
MALVTLQEILADTRKRGYGVGGFNFNGYEDAQGMVDAARDMKSPVILMASMGALKYIGLHQVVGMIEGMAEEAKVPICLHLDHATDIDLIRAAIDAGFSSVMCDSSAMPYEENIKRTIIITKYARRFPCSVEAELGKVGGQEDNINVSTREATFTDPKDVPRYVNETNIDALAIAFGSVHGFYKAEPKLDFPRLEKILSLTDVPIVLHGGTGILEEDFIKCIKMGLSKINVGTEFKKAYSDALRKACSELPAEQFDPRKFMQPVKDVCYQIAKHKFELFGSVNKA